MHKKEIYKALKKLVEKKGYWEPEKGDYYWVINPWGRIKRAIWFGNELDKFALSQGNVFKTEEDAKEYREQLENKNDL